MDRCVDNLFPGYSSGLPTRATPLDVIVPSLPALTTLLLWVTLECTTRARSTSPFTPNMVHLGKLVALACTAGQAVLAHRVFTVFDCEATFPDPMDWVVLAIVLVVAVNLLTVFALAHRYPRACTLLTFVLAVACVGGEYAGRDLIATSAVQMLVPVQQLYCVVLVTHLLHQWAGRDRRAPSHTGRKRSRTLRTVDPMAPRRKAPEDAPDVTTASSTGWSWWA